MPARPGTGRALVRKVDGAPNRARALHEVRLVTVAVTVTVTVTATCLTAETAATAATPSSGGGSEFFDHSAV